jgi:hypothetical protein
MKIKKFQEGGQAPAAPAPAPAQAKDPVAMLAEMSMQALQSGDCEIAMQVCEVFVGMIQQQMGPGPGPVEAAPQGEPVFKKGGKLTRRKCAKNC